MGYLAGRIDEDGLGKAKFAAIACMEAVPSDPESEITPR